jgi:hypothetical protein
MRSRILACILATVTLAWSVEAAPGDRGGSGRSTFGGGSSRPSSSSSRPLFGGGSSRPSTPAVRSSPPSAARPLFGGGSPRPAAPAPSPPRSLFGGGTSRPSAGKPAAVAPPARTSPQASDPGSSLAKARASRQSAADKAAAQQRVAARSAPTVTTSSGKSVRIDPAVAAKVTPAQQSTRTARSTRVYIYRDYGNWHYHTYSNDPFNPMLTGYLLAKLTEPSYAPYASRYVYNHWYEFDPVRREELLRENGALRAQLASYEAQGMPRDASYVMPGVDADLVYNDQAATRLYTPVYAGPSLLKVFIVIVAVAGVASVVYFVFFHESDALKRASRTR